MKSWCVCSYVRFLRKANAPHFLFELLSLSFALSNSHLFDFQGCERWWMCSYSWWTHFHPANNCIIPPSRLRFPWTLSCNQHNQICLQHNRSTSEKRIPWSCKVYLVSPRTVTGVRETALLSNECSHYCFAMILLEKYYHRSQARSHVWGTESPIWHHQILINFYQEMAR